ncbi:MAG TPA: alpha/beta hydrolase, partial [Acidimicrobiales bacterium]|nr:alpha/beta hydrolase [Acidimicrobiales bacterium]
SIAPMPRSKANGIDIEYETVGDQSQPPLLLVMGLGAQLIAWDDDFCRQLADQGFFVIRYDNRDVGLSTHFDSAGPGDVAAAMTAAAAGQPVKSPYLLADMADDGIGLLDALDISAAHIVGASMGGMIVQEMAIRHPDRVLSLCSIMSTTGSRDVGQPDPVAMTALMAPPPSNAEEAAQGAVNASRIIGAKGFPLDEERIRQRAIRAYKRANYPEGFARQLVAIMASPDRTDALGAVKTPTLVIHGDCDTLVTPGGGRATAEAVPGAELLMIEGMGHDLPEGAWPVVIEAIASNASKAVSA